LAIEGRRAVGDGGRRRVRRQSNPAALAEVGRLPILVTARGAAHWHPGRRQTLSRGSRSDVNYWTCPRAKCSLAARALAAVLTESAAERQEAECADDGVPSVERVRSRSPSSRQSGWRDAAAFRRGTGLCCTRAKASPCGARASARGRFRRES